MKSASKVALLSSRVLKINVGFLLSDGPGNSQDSRLDIPDPVRVADDLRIESIAGRLRLSRTKEGILAEAELEVAYENECARCLEAFQETYPITIQELYAHPQPTHLTEFFVGVDAILDLAPLLRAEVLMAASHKALCRPDCRGLCPNCGVNWNYETCTCDQDQIDPRLAKLRELLDSDDS